MIEPEPHIVVFDVGRVIVQWDMRILLDRLYPDPSDADWAHENVITRSWHGEHDAGRAIDTLVAERSASFPDHADAITAYRDRWLETIPGPVPGTIALIERLDAADVQLYAITNFGSDFWRMFCPTQPVLKLFRDIVVSGDESLVKPGRAIFDLAAQRFGRAPDEMLFIDDTRANCETAARLGWHTHHFTDARTLETDLRGRGILA
ncbi:MAG: HAD family phosphatase [Parerythrobacter sp.]